MSEDEALDYVLGYTCGNDVSERTIQFPEMKMGALLVGKGFDTFCPIGPVVATGLDPSDLRIQTRLNGETKQDGSTSDLLFSVPKLVSYISDAMTLPARRLHPHRYAFGRRPNRTGRRGGDRHRGSRRPPQPRRCRGVGGYDAQTPHHPRVEIETFTYDLSDLARGEHGPTYSPPASR